MARRRQVPKPAQRKARVPQQRGGPRGRGPQARPPQARPTGGVSGLNRPAQMRQNARPIGANRPFQGQQGFQGGLALNKNITAEPLPGVQQSGDVPVMDPNTNRRGACPPGLVAGKDPNTGASTCVQAPRGGGAAKGGAVNFPTANNKNTQGY